MGFTMKRMTEEQLYEKHSPIIQYRNKFEQNSTCGIQY